MSEPLTERQTEVLEAIRHAIAQTGLPPTRTELARLLGVRSANAAESHLQALARKGAISLRTGASRGIRILAPPAAAVGLPIVGRVAAGEPVLATEHIEDWHQIDPALFHPRADYLLRVQGSSMQDVGILDGDLLAVHTTAVATNGQIVVARIGDEVTVKRYNRIGNLVTLKAENRDFSPILVDLRTENFMLEGRGVGILRTQGL